MDRSATLLVLFLLLLAPDAALVADVPPECGVTHLTGRVHRVVKDEDSKARIVTLLHDLDTGRSYELQLTAEQESRVPSGAIVSANVIGGGPQAVLCGDTIDVPKGVAVAPSGLLGTRRAVVVLVNFADAPLTPRCDQVAVRDMFYGAKPSVASYFTEVSFGRIVFEPDTDGEGLADVFGPFTIDASVASSCDISAVADQADAKATLAGVNLSAYQHRVYLLPDEANCGYWGSVACNDAGDSKYCRVWVTAPPPWWPEAVCDRALTFAHELGHNLGLRHASMDADADGVVDPNGEYGDPADVMGQCCGSFYQFNAPHKQQLGLFGAEDGTVVTVPATGGPYDYTIAASEIEPSLGSPPRLLRLGEWHASTRAAIGYDSDLDYWLQDYYFVGRTSLHRFEEVPLGVLPRTLFSATLDDGEAFADTVGGFLIEQLAHTPTTVQVRVWTPPAFEITDASAVEGDAGTKTLRFTVTLDRPSPQTLSVDYATSSQSATSGEDYETKTGALTFLPDEMTHSIDVTIHGDASCEWDESFVVTLSNPSTGASIADAQGSGTITDDDRPPAPANVSATANGTTSVTITWGSVTGAASYDVYRTSNGSSFEKIGSTATSSFADMTPTPGAAYLYAVRSIGEEGCDSALSAPDLATTVVFTDSTITARTTRVKAAHVIELRSAIAAVRALAGLGAYGYTDPAINPGATRVKATHILQMRTALDVARAELGLAAPSYTDAILSTSRLVRAVHISELRGGVK